MRSRRKLRTKNAAPLATTQIEFGILCQGQSVRKQERTFLPKSKNSTPIPVHKIYSICVVMSLYHKRYFLSIFCRKVLKKRGKKRFLKKFSSPRII